ncbi:MAG: class I tRNA ligase family protein, partial [Candidatus Thorarchaeota archaeon]
DRGLDPDYLRYYMVSSTSQTKDLDFAWASFADKVNNELVATLGNFIYRGLHFTSKHYGEVPKGQLDAKLKKAIQDTIETVIDATNEYELKKVSDAILGLASIGNEYFQANKPWALVKQDKEKCGEVLFNALALTKALAILIDPILPSAAEKVWKQIGFESDVHTVQLTEALNPLEVGSKLGKPVPVISKIDDALLAELKEATDARIKAAEAAQKSKSKEDEKVTEHEPVKETISFDEFQRVDLRIGKIARCERVPKKDRLLKITVDIGIETRTMATGLGHLYEPEELEGVTALFLVNLEPKKIGGIESHGMILAVEKLDEPGKWVPVKVDGIPPGSKAA